MLVRLAFAIATAIDPSKGRDDIVTPVTATLSTYSREKSVLRAPPAPGVRLIERNTFRSSRVSMMGMPCGSTRTCRSIR